MPSDNRGLNWPVIGQVALNLVVLGMLVIVFANDRRLTASEQQTAELAARLSETSAVVAKADQRIAALEKSAALAATDRETLRAAGLKTAGLVETTKATLDATASGLAAAQQRVAALERSEAQTKAALEALTQAGEATAAAGSATKASLDATASALADAQQRVGSLENAASEAKADRNALRQAGEETAAAVGATKLALDGATAGLASANQKLAEAATGLGAVKASEEALGQEQRRLQGSIDAATSSVAKLKADLAWRELPDATRSALVAALSKAGPNAITLMYMANDSESHYFANRVGAAFKAAGWRVVSVAASFPGVLITGVVLNKADNRPTSDVATAMQASGLDFLATEVPEPSESFGDDRQGVPVTLVIGAHALH